MIGYRRTSALAAALAATVLLASGCTETPDGSSAEGAPGGARGTALAAVDTLTVKGRAPKTGYEREKFGRAWADVDGNGCGTRVISILRRAIEAFAQLTQGVVSCA